MNRTTIRFELGYGPGSPQMAVELTYHPNTLGGDGPARWSVAEYEYYTDGGEDSWVRWDDTYKDFPTDDAGTTGLRRWMAQYVNTDTERALFEAFVTATRPADLPKPTHTYTVQYTSGIRQAMWAVEAIDAVDAIQQRWSSGNRNQWIEVELESFDYSDHVWAGRTFVNRFNGASVMITAMLQKVANA